MEAIETPGLEIIFDNVYAKDRPWMFREGLEELRSVGQRELVKPLNAGAAETTEEGV